MLIMIDDLTRGLVVRPATSRERLSARARAGSLDRQLAAGTPPETTALLALRAATLVRPKVRHRFARSLQQIMRYAASAGPHRSVVLTPLTCRNILNAAVELNRLTERLVSPCPVSARGVAMVEILLTDGAGPLYYPARASQLPASVGAAMDALDGPVIS